MTELKYLAGYIRPHKWVLIFSFLLSVLGTTLGLIQPYFAKVLIDTVFMGNRPEFLAPLLTIVIFLFMTGFCIRVTNNYLYTRYSARILFQMRQDMFDHLQRIPLVFLTRRKIGDIHSRIASDMAEIQGLLTDLVPHFIFNALTCLITAGVLLWLNWQMALMSFVFLPVGLFVVHRFRPKVVALSKNLTETNAEISHFLFESLANAPLIRVFGAGKVESGKLSEKHDRVLRYLLQYQILGALSGTVPTLFVIINTLVVFGYGGLLVFDGHLTIGSLVAFSIYQGRVFAPLRGLMDGILTLQKSTVPLSRIREILDVRPMRAALEDEVSLKPRSVKGGIVFKDVSFSYDEGEPVVENLSLEIPEGKTTAVIGPSGVGKTTLCHLICRLLLPKRGQILLDGIDLQRVPAKIMRSSVSLVSQDILLSHTTIRDNIRFGRPDATDEDIIAAAKKACAHDFIMELPGGYDASTGDRGVRLSGGQKQRLCLARALLMDPKVLVLDEATAFLDGAVENRLKETLQDLLDGRTLVVVSHRETAIRHADHVIQMAPIPDKRHGCQQPQEGLIT